MAAVDTSIQTAATGQALATVEANAAPASLQLYGAWFCPYVQRAWISLLEKGIPHQYTEINPYHKEPHFLALNPRGLVPTLAIEGKGPGGSPATIWDSAVICEYLEDLGDAEGKKSLLPSDPFARGRCRVWIDHINKKIIPGFYKLLQHQPQKSYTMDEARQELRGNIAEFVKQMDPSGPWFLGESISLVDICLIPWERRLWLIDHYKQGGVGLPSDGPDKEVWDRWGKWTEAVGRSQSTLDTMSDKKEYIGVYKRYADDTTNSEVGRATREGGKLP